MTPIAMPNEAITAANEAIDRSGSQYECARVRRSQPPGAAPDPCTGPTTPFRCGRVRERGDRQRSFGSDSLLRRFNGATTVTSEGVAMGRLRRRLVGPTWCLLGQVSKSFQCISRIALESSLQDQHAHRPPASPELNGQHAQEQVSPDTRHTLPRKACSCASRPGSSRPRIQQLPHLAILTIAYFRFMTIPLADICAAATDPSRRCTLVLVSCGRVATTGRAPREGADMRKRHGDR
jgi:hypothetical protein